MRIILRKKKVVRLEIEENKVVDHQGGINIDITLKVSDDLVTKDAEVTNFATVKIQL